MQIEEFRLTKHAIDRALDMGIDGEAIRQCLIHPEWVSNSRKYHGRKNYRFGDVVCTVAKDKSVVTVQWATHEAWRDDMAYGEYGGRSLRTTDVAV